MGHLLWRGISSGGALLVVGHPTARDSTTGTLRSDSFSGQTEGGLLSGTFECNEKYIWVPFLEEEVNKVLSLEAIWNFSNGVGIHESIWGTEGRL